MLKSVSFKNLPNKCKCGLWDIDTKDYDVWKYVGIRVVDIPKCRSAKKFNSLGIGQACFDGIEYQGYGVKHYVDYHRGFGDRNGCSTTTGFEDGTMADLLDHVTCGSEVYLHWMYLKGHPEAYDCECKT